MKLSPDTVLTAIRRFESRGKNSALFISKGKKTGRPRKVLGSKHIEDLLLKGTLLR